MPKKKKVNPWAICTTSVGRDDKAKYERCVMDVKGQNKRKSAMDIPPGLNDQVKTLLREHGPLSTEEIAYYLSEWLGVEVSSGTAHDALDEVANSLPDGTWNLKARSVTTKASRKAGKNDFDTETHCHCGSPLRQVGSLSILPV